jgi:hypothetical protein
VVLQTIFSIKEINQMTPQFLDNKFLALRQDLPEETEQLAVELGAFVRPRVLRSPLQLLHAVLLYCLCDLRLREIAALFSLTRRSISDEGIRSRLKRCAPWLQQLVARALAKQLPELSPSGWRLLLCDGSVLSAPGAKMVDYRYHLAFDPLCQQSCQLLMSDYRDGEKLSRFALASGDLVVADRSFAKARQLLELRQRGAHFAIRCSPQYLQLRDRQGQALDLMAALRANPEATRQSFSVQVCDARSGERVAAFVHCQRLSEAQSNRARRKARRKSSKACKSIKAETLFLCEWVLVVTSVPPTELSAEVILALYRVRWQIELLIKRFKSLLGGDQLRARRDGQLAEVWLWGKLLYAIVVEKYARQRCGLAGVEMSSKRRTTWWRVWHLLTFEVKEMVLNSSDWEAIDWRQLMGKMSERERRRQLQSLPPKVVEWLRQTPLMAPPGMR